MAFFKENRRLSYLEVYEINKSLVEDGILEELQPEELNNIFLRLLKFIEDELKVCLEKMGYDIQQSKEILNDAIKLRLISNSDVWKDCITYKQYITESQLQNINREQLIDFMSSKFMNAIKVLKDNPSSISKILK